MSAFYKREQLLYLPRIYSLIMVFIVKKSKLVLAFLILIKVDIAVSGAP